MHISVLISTFNRGSQLRETLGHFRALKTEGLTWELVVVDNGCTDDTPQVLREAGQTLPLVPLEEPTPGKNRALNLALRHARGSLLVFTDDDIIPDPDWLREIVAGETRWPQDAIFAGRIEPRFPVGTPDWMRDPGFRFSWVAYGRYMPPCDEGSTPRFPHGGNFAVRAGLFEGVRYDEAIGPQGVQYAMASEAHLLRRFAAAGERFIYLPRARVQHVIRPDQVNTRWLFERAFAYGRAQATVGRREEVTHLFGAPRYQWRKLAEQWLGYWRCQLGDAKARCEAGIQLHELRGYLSEYRRLGREKRSQATSQMSSDTARNLETAPSLEGICPSPVSELEGTGPQS